MTGSLKSLKTAVAADAPADQGPAGWLGFLLNTLGERLRTQTYEALRPWGLAARDLGALESVAAVGAQSQVELGRSIRMDRTSVVQLVDRLEAAGWLARTPNPEDRRVHLLQLTPEGAERLKAVRELAAKAERDFTRQMSAGDLAKLKSELRRLL